MSNNIGVDSTPLVHYYIYAHLLKENPQLARYVGSTTKQPEQRWGHNGYHYQAQYFYQAILKYGWSAFDHIILEEGNASVEEMLTREEYWTDYYHADDLANGGYVKQKGKTSPPNQIGTHFSEERLQAHKERMNRPDTVEKIRAAMTGRHLTEETKQKLSIANTGKIRDADTIEKYRHAKAQSCGKQVHCVETGINYESINAAARAVGLKGPSSITRSCQDETGKKIAGGYHWRFLKN